MQIDELVIRPWVSSDAPTAAYRDPDIQKWHVRTMTRQESVTWVHEQSVRWAAETGAGWAVADGLTVVGRVGFRTLDLAEGAAETAYWVTPEARRRAIAARALNSVVNWLMHEVGFHRVTLDHAVFNTASCRVAARAGFALEGTARQQVLHADGWHDMHLHARLRPMSMA